MVNAKWSYKGYLEGIKITMIEGKGFTVINDILYRTKEFDFLNQFKKLLFQIEFYISKNNYIKSIDSSIISDNINKESIKNNSTMKIKKNENKNNQIKIKDIEIIKHNKDNSRPNEKFIKLKNDNTIKNIEDYDSDNNVFQQLKHKNNIYHKNSSIKHTYPGNHKRYSHNIENFENNNTNIDFNIIIDKAKTNCCESCFEYEHLSKVCCIF